MAERRSQAAPAALAAAGAAGLAVVLAGGIAIAAGGAGRARFFFVPSSVRGGFPGWLAGPLHGLGVELTPHDAAVWLVAMAIGYAVAVAVADRLPAAPALAVVVALHAAFLLAPPLFSADVFGYIDYARLGVLHDLSPYTHGAAAAVHDPVFRFVRWHNIFTPYGPVFTLLSYPLALLPVAAALWTLKAVAALASLTCVALVGVLARRRGHDPLRAALLVGLNPLLLAYGVGGAHNDFLFMALLLFAALLVTEGRDASGGAAAAFAAGIKASAGIVAPFLVLGARRRASAIAGAVAAAIALAVVALAVFGGDGLGFIGQIDHQQHLVATQSVPNQLGKALGHHGITSGIRTVLGIGFAIAVLLALWRTWRGADWIAGAGWATLALLVSTAWLVPWYVVWLLPLAATGGSRRLRLGALAFTAYVVFTRVSYYL